MSPSRPRGIFLFASPRKDVFRSFFFFPPLYSPVFSVRLFFYLSVGVLVTKLPYYSGLPVFAGLNGAFSVAWYFPALSSARSFNPEPSPFSWIFPLGFIRGAVLPLFSFFGFLVDMGYLPVFPLPSSQGDPFSGAGISCPFWVPFVWRLV